MWKKKWLRIFWVVILVMIVISSLLQAITPEPVPKEGIVTSELSYEPEISFGSIVLDVPEKIAVYINLQDKSAMSEEIREQFVDQLELDIHRSETNWRNEEGTIMMHQNIKNELVLSFHDTLDLFPPIGTPENRTAALANVESLLVKIGLKQNTQIAEPDYVLLDNHAEYVDSQSKANALEFRVQFLLDGIPFFSDSTTNPPLTVWTDLSGKVLRATFYPVGNTFEKRETYNSLGLGQLKQQIAEKNFIFIDVKRQNTAIGDINQLDSVVFNSAKLEYRKNEQNGYIVPYIRFYGVGKANDEMFDVEAITPAVKVQ